MTWFKVDDKFYDHPKAREAGARAVGVWLFAGTWSADHETDGFVPASVLSRWGTRADARRLVEVGFWYAASHGREQGWQFHDWAQYQPTKAEKEARREVKREAGRLGGQASGRSRREAQTKQSASPLVEPKRTPVPVPVPVTNSSPLSTQDLARIAEQTGGGPEHAAKVAKLILGSTTSQVDKPLPYILRAISNDRDGKYRFRRGSPKKHQECRDHPGQWPDNCGPCASERLATGTPKLRVIRNEQPPLQEPPPMDEPDFEPDWSEDLG